MQRPCGQQALGKKAGQRGKSTPCGPCGIRKRWFCSRYDGKVSGKMDTSLFCVPYCTLSLASAFGLDSFLVLARLGLAPRCGRGPRVSASCAARRHCTAVRTLMGNPKQSRHREQGRVQVRVGGRPPRHVRPGQWQEKGPFPEYPQGAAQPPVPRLSPQPRQL